MRLPLVVCAALLVALRGSEAVPPNQPPLFAVSPWIYPSPATSGQAARGVPGMPTFPAFVHSARVNQDIQRMHLLYQQSLQRLIVWLQWLQHVQGNPSPSPSTTTVPGIRRNRASVSRRATSSNNVQSNGMPEKERIRWEFWQLLLQYDARIQPYRQQFDHMQSRMDELHMLRSRWLQQTRSARITAPISSPDSKHVYRNNNAGRFLRQQWRQKALLIQQLLEDMRRQYQESDILPAVKLLLEKIQKLHRWLDCRVFWELILEVEVMQEAAQEVSAYLAKLLEA